MLKERGVGNPYILCVRQEVKVGDGPSLLPLQKAVAANKRREVYRQSLTDCQFGSRSSLPPKRFLSHPLEPKNGNCKIGGRYGSTRPPPTPATRFVRSRRPASETQPRPRTIPTP